MNLNWYTNVLKPIKWVVLKYTGTEGSEGPEGYEGPEGSEGPLR